MTYSRQAFREWLKTLPDAPFCASSNQCPVSAYMVSVGLIECEEFQCGEAYQEDCNLIDAIDDIAYLDDETEERHWDRITPSQVIAIMDELQ